MTNESTQTTSQCHTYEPAAETELFEPARRGDFLEEEGQQRAKLFQGHRPTHHLYLQNKDDCYYQSLQQEV